MKNVTFFIYLDACRYDYISYENTPFLYKLSQIGFLGRIQTSKGFTQEVVMKTGKHPVETGYFTWYRYAPENSPFLWIKSIKFLQIFRKYRIYYPIKVGIRTITKILTGKQYPDPAFIPLEILPYFERMRGSLPNNILNLEDLCQQNKISYFEPKDMYGFIGSKKFTKLLEPIISSIRSENPHDIYFIHIGELDGLGHLYGPNPLYFKNNLKNIDSWIEKIYDIIRKLGLRCNFIICSDHGMSEIVDTMDIEKILKNLKFKIPRDYLYFLDSTMARFWFFNDKAKRAIEKCLSTFSHGHILTEEEKEKFHINFNNNDYGDLIFWVEKGYIIFPNFFQSIMSERRKTRGMHGYTNDSDGILIIYSDYKNIKNIIDYKIIELHKIFDIVRNIVGL